MHSSEHTFAPCPVCECPVTKVEEGGAEHDEWGRKMWDNPDVRYFQCGRVECHYPDAETEVHEAEACAVIRALRSELHDAVGAIR